MTSQSLKSRRITASNGATANKLRRAIATLCRCGFALGFCGFTAANLFAAEPAATLKWKSRGTAAPAKVAVSEPRRLEMPKPREVQREVQLVAHETMPTQAVAPLDDPFGDKTKPTPAAPNILPQTLDPMPKPGDLPNFGDSPLPGISPGTQSAQGTGTYKNDVCPKPADLKPIAQLTNVIAASIGDLPQECTIDDRVEPSTNRPWECLTFTWKASGLCHKPLYFEEQQLERYGHSTGPISQPLVSAAHFFGTLPILPYKMGIRAPWECEYALGYYRPGSCAPYIIPGVPITARAIGYQAGAVAGLSYILP